MPWRVVERRIGRAGGLKERTARQREWDGKYGEGNWEVGYVIDGEFVTQAEASRSITAATRITSWPIPRTWRNWSKLPGV